MIFKYKGRSINLNHVTVLEAPRTELAAFILRTTCGIKLLVPNIHREAIEQGMAGESPKIESK